MALDSDQNTSPRGWYFYSDIALRILAAHRDGLSTVTLSLDLNISEKAWPLKGGFLVLDPGTGGRSGPQSQDLEIGLRVSMLEAVARDPEKVFWFDGKALNPLEVRSDGYYKLVPTDSVPFLEINGIKMHRSKDIDPLEDARAKTALVVRPGNLVLDTCGGLGYSAIFALKAGAVRVVSTERSAAVMALRSQNPWTRTGGFPWLTAEMLARLDLAHADITRHIEGLPEKRFDAVVHDPPRFSAATGDLYGRQFYGHLARVMKKGGRLFHYTGSPKKIKNGDRFVANAARRLEQAGFDKVDFIDRLQGLVAQKAEPPRI